MEIVFGYLAGLLTLINPCVLPILPIVLASSLQFSKRGPVVLAAGLMTTFVIVGFGVALFGRSLGIDDVLVSRIGALMMVLFGAVLLVPQLSARFSLATAGFANRADRQFDTLDRTRLQGQFFGGMLLGLVWVPCVGPTLGGAIALAYAGENLAWAFATMVSFALGIGTVVIALGLGAQSAIRARRNWMLSLSGVGRPVMGGIFVLTGLSIWFGWLTAAEIWLLDTLPYWMQDLSVRY